ncbi:putative polyketide synthase [Daldinia decipiens]|uniref:putative polyketide synthase n=1 Tax=Daldinia decipiens TaxID=326647 RepID=UPI0020C1C9EB|nr:putative polyketide synthase [Daldinia decipiens]KAI1662268.1 putative polyketide synthase [Daldinia decipiens]
MPRSIEEEPIAVCGLSLNFPQDASSEKDFWTMILNKRSAMTMFPRDRLNVDAFYHPTQRHALRTRGAHFIKEDLGVFDANFFSLTPTEASAMDPMQRILLETTYKALENAGIRLEDVKGSRSSVHTGCFTNDYLQLILKDSERLPPYAAVGATQSMIANRLSWFFDLRGPSVNLDSACSSSAMAVDLSCQLLLSGVTDMGIVAGCNLLLDPDYSTILSNMQMLSPDGRCFTFDHRANGYSRGEGVAVVILKRLSDALRYNDTIRAIIRSTGTNQDGRTPGITQPDLKAQAQLIRETYKRANLSMEHTRFFEAHGTGTAIGDPMEVGAIADSFHKYRNSSDPLYVGSVKTNIGHLEGASGIAGLIKAILAVESGIIPPNTNFESLNRKLASYDYVITLPAEPIVWPACEVRRASINSFGYGGTNSHIVIDDVSSYLRHRGLVGNFRTANPYFRTENLLLSTTIEEFPKLLVWSASTGIATQRMVSTWGKYCSKMLDIDAMPSVSDIAYTLDSRRTSLPAKSFAVVSATSDIRALVKLASTPINTPKQSPRLAFVFTGQGAQWYAMGRELLMYPDFLESIQAAESILVGMGCSWSCRDQLLKDEKESMIDYPSISQSLTAVVQMALVDLLRSFGISPVAVVGHSMGEIAASYCAELLTRESALRIVYYRGYFTATISKQSRCRGAMLAVALSAEEVTNYFNNMSCDHTNIDLPLVVSCINSPRSTTVSGEESEIERLRQILESKGIFARRLRVPVAYHSPQMNLVVSDCLKHFGILKSPQPKANIKMISSVTGSILTRERACQGTYWTANLVSPVLFSQAVERLCRDSTLSLRKKIDGSHHEAIVVDNLIEIGPHAALRLPIEEVVETLPRRKSIKYLSALYRKQSASVTLLRLLGQLYCSGVPIDLRRVNDPEQPFRRSRICLADAPEYPFDHSTRYWCESPLVRNYRLRAHGHVELLGSPSRDWNPLEPQWRCYVQVSDMPWLVDHKLNGRAVYPASAMISMAIQGVSQLANRYRNMIGFTLHNIRYQSAIAVPSESGDLETRLQLKPLKVTSAARSSWGFSVHSVTSGNWAENCSGVIEVHYETELWAEEDKQKSHYYKDHFQKRDTQCYKVFDSIEIYNNFIKHGFHYGPSFQGITTVNHDGTDTLTAKLSLSSPLSGSTVGSSFIIHPGTLDSFLHLALVSLSGGDKIIPTQAISRIDKIWISAEGFNLPHKSIQASAKFEGETARTKLYSGFALSDDKEHLRLVVEGLQTTIIASDKRPEEIAGHDQFWCSVQTAVDVDALSGTRILQRLESICGPDPPGPSKFFSDIRRYLYFMVKELRKSVTAMGTDSTKPYLRRYVSWMDWQLSQTIDDASITDDGSLRIRVAKHGFLGGFILKVADNALNVLQGKSDMVQLFFEDNLIGRFYEELLASSICYQKLQSYLADLSFKYPNLDFLEVGAGTGSFTEHVLKGVSSTASPVERFNSYYYTDISSTFFEGARERFPACSRKLKFAVLNVEEDPLRQGFKENMFDVISASNILHITDNLDLTLQRLRKLLKPGGKFLLHEYIHPDRIDAGFIFGLLPGWWPKTDETRVLSPLLNEESWNMLLRRNGFSGTDFILRDYADEESHLMSIICATAVESKDVVFPDVTIVVQPGSSVQEDMAIFLASKLSVEGSRVIRMDLSKPQEDISSLGNIITLFDLEEAILSRLDEGNFEPLKSILLRASRILWVSKADTFPSSPSHGMIEGFARVFRMENINCKLATLTLETDSESQIYDCNHILFALKNGMKSQGFNQPEDYIVVDGFLKLSRIYENIEFKKAISEKLPREMLTTESVKDARPFTITFYDSESLLKPQIVEDNSTFSPIGPEEVEIEIKALGLGPIDFSILSGNISNINIGRECAGIVTKVGANCDIAVGDRVCAYSADLFYSTSRAKRNLVAKIPESLSFEEASTLPQDSCIANYIVREARIQRDELVIVRGGDTRLGRATLDVLKKYGPKLCATISTPGDEPFFSGIQKLTESCFTESFKSCFSEKANVILDFVGTDMLQLTECVSKFGQILSIREVSDDSSIPISLFELPATVGFRILDVVAVLQHQLDRLEMPFSEVGETTSIHPFHVKTIDLSVIETVSSHIRDLDREERIVIKYDDESQIQIHKKSVKGDLFDPSASYVISGGLGDLGRCIAEWMVSRGARNLILLSRSGPRNKAARTTIQHLEQSGAKVYTPACDISDHSSLQRVLQQLQDIPAIKGCVQAAGVLKDIMYDKMSFEDWKVAVDPKVSGSWNLHNLLPKGMDFFILTSSITGIMGQATQINYSSGNTYQDALARYRLAIGEKAVSLDLGLLSTGGLLSQNKGLAERFAAENVYTVLSESDILALFDHFCDPNLGLDQIPAQIVSGIINPSLQDRRSPSFPLAFHHPFWSHTLVQSGNGQETGDSPDATVSVGRTLISASSVAEMGGIVAGALADHICSLVRTPRENIDLEEPLRMAGADSLSAVYLRNWIKKEFAVDVAVFDILGDMSIIALGNSIASEWREARIVR